MSVPKAPACEHSQQPYSQLNFALLNGYIDKTVHSCSRAFLVIKQRKEYISSKYGTKDSIIWEEPHSVLLHVETNLQCLNTDCGHLDLQQKQLWGTWYKVTSGMYTIF